MPGSTAGMPICFPHSSGQSPDRDRHQSDMRGVSTTASPEGGRAMQGARRPDSAVCFHRAVPWREIWLILATQQGDRHAGSGRKTPCGSGETLIRKLKAPRWPEGVRVRTFFPGCARSLRPACRPSIQDDAGIGGSLRDMVATAQQRRGIRSRALLPCCGSARPASRRRTVLDQRLHQGSRCPSRGARARHRRKPALACVRCVSQPRSAACGSEGRRRKRDSAAAL